MQKIIEIKQWVPEIWEFKGLELILLRETKKRKKYHCASLWQPWLHQNHDIYYTRDIRSVEAEWRIAHRLYSVTLSLFQQLKYQQCLQHPPCHPMHLNFKQFLSASLLSSPLCIRLDNLNSYQNLFKSSMKTFLFYFQELRFSKVVSSAFKKNFDIGMKLL